MKFDKIKNLVGSVAPTIATALGGPLAGTAASAIAQVLGVNAQDPKALEKAMANATPEQLTEIKKAELDFEARMKELDVDLFALETADIQDARKRNSKDWTARALALGTVASFAGYVFLVTLQPPDANSEAVINLVLGYLGGMVSAVISFYFGASHKQDN
jgi:hypothetical protein